MMAQGTVESEVQSLVTSALNKVSSLKPWPLQHEGQSPVLIELNAGWASQLVAMIPDKRKISFTFISHSAVH